MGTVRRIDGLYYIEFEARGLTYQQRAGTHEPEAWALLARVEEQLRQGRLELEPRDPDGAVFFHDVVEESGQIHTPPTCRRLAAAAADFQGFLSRQHPGLPRVSQLTPRVMALYTADLRGRLLPGKAARVLNLTLILLGEIFAAAVRKGILNDNPLLHVRFSPAPGPGPACLDAEMIRRLRGQLPPRAWAAMQLVLHTGLKQHECRQLTARDVDADGKRIKITTRTGNLFKDVPCDEDAGAAVDVLRSGRGETEPLILSSDLLLEAGFPTGAYQTLRNTFARRVLRQGAGFGRLYRMMGERDIAAVVPYTCYIQDRIPEKS